ncbi:hypothetical protein P280DRAFT_417930 [Massarina eburnea CBS 473.64]|uniref:SNF2 family helicase n=1 Tax=Massarina eburnea CBS 473.64 TaxID=1395130 RepID=A0A6A6SDG1_9PLEO|nr:hypothetical protein P280DRAFT_417930 [Massarina eburnea CBS 473.64]
MSSNKRGYDAYSNGQSPSQSSSQGYARSYASSQSQRAPKQPRTAPYGNGSSQQEPLVIDDDDDEEEDEEDGSQEVPDSTQGYSDAALSYVMYGKLDTKIVGVRFYNGYATMGEMAICRREPQNPYDRNALQILNVQGAQIGHIPKGFAAKLAPYMDRRDLIVEAIITGEKGQFDCPVSLRLYGTNEPNARTQLINRMRADKLPVTGATAVQREEQQRQKLAEQAAKRAQKKRTDGAVVGVGQGQQYENGMGQFVGGASSQGVGPGPSLEDIIGSSERFNPRNIEQFVEEFGIKETDLSAMPKATQPKTLVTQMHDFQLQGLQWLLDKESPQLPAEGTKDVVQLWQRHPTMRNAFTNLATNYSVTNPVLASGGILADDMGLGKTIQVISLIMADRELGRRAQDSTNTTLILAPVSVMSNWSTQMKLHIKPEHALRIMFYHGTRKQPITPKSIEEYDVVISTYDSISSEWHSQKSTALPRRSGAFSVKWRRVILDEAHSIRNPKAKKTIAISNLAAQSRWSLTGTPIINNLKDLFSQIRFLRLSGGLDSLEIFNGAIMRPVLQGDTRGNRSLQMLMGGICLRRKKEMSFIDLRLPELTEYVHKVNLLPHEQEKYDALDAQAKGTLDLYRNKMGGRDASETYRHLLEVLLRMRQVCNHWQLVGEERLETIMKQLEAEGVVDLTEENKSALQKMLQLTIDSQEDCPVCIDTLKEPVITKCAHIFCSACIEQVIQVQHKCPMCRAELDSVATTTVKPVKELAAPPPPTQEELADKESLESNSSSKVNALLSILKASSKDPSNKTIIFSQWTRFLDALQPHLTAAGFTYTRIDGSMTAIQRDAALETFDNSPECTILLASLAVCSVGLNLVAANQVVLSDSWWAPAIEDQAVDRVHRLGQKRETKVFRLVVEGSIEERVLGIQEDKRKLMGLAFAEKDAGKKKKRGATGLADLEKLLGGRAAAPASAAAQESDTANNDGNAQTTGRRAGRPSRK